MIYLRSQAPKIAGESEGARQPSHAAAGVVRGSGASPRRRKDGGARRNRTADLLNAIQALSQLSYDPLKPSSRHMGVAKRGGT